MRNSIKPILHIWLAAGRRPAAHPILTMGLDGVVMFKEVIESVEYIRCTTTLAYISDAVLAPREFRRVVKVPRAASVRVSGSSLLKL